MLSVSRSLRNGPPLLSVASGLGQGQGSADWSPLQLPALELWLRADLGIVLNGTKVSGWLDQSGKGRHVAQTTSSKQPQYRSINRDMNARPSMVGTSAAGWGLHNLTTGVVPQSSARTVFAATRQISPATYATLIDFTRAAPDWACLDFSIGAYTYGTGPTNTNVPSPPAQLVGYTRNVTWQTGGTGTPYLFWSNGVDYSASQVGTTLAPAESASTGFAIGTRPYGAANYSGIQSYDGDIAEVIVCSAALDSNQIALCESYLAKRYRTVANVVTVGPLPDRQPLQWLKASVGVTTVSGGVSLWSDRSGNGDRDMLQGTPVRRPTVQANAINGQPAIVFDGVDDMLVSSYPRAEPHVLVVVAKYLGAFGALYDSTTAVNRNRFYRSGAAQISVGDGTQAAVAAPTLDTWHAHIVQCSGAAGTYRQENTAAVSAPTGSPADADGLTLGSLAGGQYYGNVAIAEVLVYPGSFSAAELATLLAYINTEYGLH